LLDLTRSRSPERSFSTRTSPTRYNPQELPSSSSMSLLKSETIPSGLLGRSLNLPTSNTPLTLQIRTLLVPFEAIPKVPGMPIRHPHGTQPIRLPRRPSQNPPSSTYRDCPPCRPSPPRHWLESSIRQPWIRIPNPRCPQSRIRRHLGIPKTMFRSTNGRYHSMEVGNWRCGLVG
jgi:hypothetical protein